MPTERCTSLTGPSSAFLSTPVRFPFNRLTLTDLHHVLAITARRWATTLPPSSIPYAGIFASPHMGYTVLEFPSSARRDVLATRSCLLYAERIRDSPGGRGDPAWPPLSHFGPGVSATSTCLLLRRLRRFLIVSIGHRGSPIIRRVAGRSRYIVHRLHTPRRATP